MKEWIDVTNIRSVNQGYKNSTNEDMIVSVSALNNLKIYVGVFDHALVQKFGESYLIDNDIPSYEVLKIVGFDKIRAFIIPKDNSYYILENYKNCSDVVQVLELREKLEND